MGWYYAYEGKQIGPITDAELAQLVSAGTITAATLVWQPGQAEWKSYGEVAGLGRAADSDHAVCAVSGKVRPKREMIEYEGKWVSAEHRDEFFQRLRQGAPIAPHAEGAVPGPYGYGGFWLRFVARLLDSLVLMALFVPLMFVFGMVVGLSAAGGGEPNIPLILIGYFFLIVTSIGAGIFYEVYCIRKWDATIGKRALGLRILRADGSRLTTGRAVGRYFGYMLSSFIPLAIGFIMAGIDSEKRALHDLICDTRVVRTRL